MPLPSSSRILLLGDSHLGSAAKAIRAADAMDRFEIWGASGSNFRNLKIEGGAIYPGTPEVAEQISRVNGRGLERLETGMFDRVIIVGGRLRMSEFLVPMAGHMIRQSGSVSGPVLRACAQRWTSARGIKMVDCLFPQGGTIAYIAAPLMFRRRKAKFAQPQVPRELIETLRGVARDALHERGVALIQQPMHSVTNDMFTADEHAAPNRKRDFTHVTPALMHGMLDTALAAIEESKLTACAIRVPDGQDRPPEYPAHL